MNICMGLGVHTCDHMLVWKELCTWNYLSAHLRESK